MDIEADSDESEGGGGSAASLSLSASESRALLGVVLCLLLTTAALCSLLLLLLLSPSSLLRLTEGLTVAVTASPDAEYPERLTPAPVAVRRRWLDRHVPLPYLHALQRAVRDGRPVPPLPAASVSSPLAAFFASYTAFHAAELRNLSESTRLLVHRPQHYSEMGMGNRLLGLISAFLYAALTRRVLVMHWRHSGDAFSLPDVFAQPPIDWEPDRLLQRFGGEDGLKRRLDGAQLLTLFEHWGDNRTQRAYEHLLCDDWSEAGGGLQRYDAPLLLVESNQFFAPLLAHNRHFRAALAQAGFSAGRLSPAIIHFLLQPSPAIQRRVDDFRAENFRHYTIGIQIRTGDGHGSSDAITKLGFRCASVLTETLPHELLQRGEVAWYVASDNPQVLELGRAVLRNRSERVSMSYAACPINYDLDGIQCSLLHMFLLAETDDLVMTKASTFGDFGHARSMLQPMVTTEQLTCFRQPVVDPCFHHWHYAPRVSCYRPDETLDAEDVNGYCVGRRDP